MNIRTNEDLSERMNQRMNEWFPERNFRMNEWDKIAVNCWCSSFSNFTESIFVSNYERSLVENERTNEREPQNRRLTNWKRRTINHHGIQCRRREHLDEKLDKIVVDGMPLIIDQLYQSQPRNRTAAMTWDKNSFV